MKKKTEGHLSIWQILLKNKLTLVGLVVILALTILGLISKWITPYDPYTANMAVALRAPSKEFLFGTDNFGRDIFSRLLVGTKTSLWLGLISVSISAVIGIFLGGISGYYGGTLGIIIMRLMDALSAFPALILAICIATVIGRGVGSAIIAVGIVGIPGYARLMYSQTLSIKARGYIEAARAIGESKQQILCRHIIPNCLPALIVNISTGMGTAILVISALSFLGLGIQEPAAEWGMMISSGRSYIVSGRWWISAFPGIAIMITTLCFNLIGDGLRDILDPRVKTGN